MLPTPTLASKLSLSWRAGLKVAVVPLAVLQALRESLWGQWGAPWSDLACPLVPVDLAGRNMLLGGGEGGEVPFAWLLTGGHSYKTTLILLILNSCEVSGIQLGGGEGTDHKGAWGAFGDVEIFRICFSWWLHSCIQLPKLIKLYT